VIYNPHYRIASSTTLCEASHKADTPALCTYASNFFSQIKYGVVLYSFLTRPFGAVGGQKPDAWGFLVARSLIDCAILRGG
jgi:hypothetical protein